ncbi:DUF1800 domain-containing protein [Inhella gelatinilytica]|uniref:DUF1800 domain-containing protein n=1 Tax=Inhella gelatinilytica TaxID=2795030 RepID=A0A931NCI0_9BURK|nr:DUF1800 domain-containing protein [Inhella gelatinilytica]MBH9552032.1 DUF1800 domain-containing protein [Inhella gelatinilytica]
MKRRSLLWSPALLGATVLPGWANGAVAGSGSAAEALHACNRLGFGPRPGDLNRGPGWAEALEQQLAGPEVPAALQARLAAIEARQAPLGERIEAYRVAQQRDPGENNAERRALVVQAQRDAVEARLVRALESPRQLEERLVAFWFNHFNVFQDKGLCRMMVADYEARAIRPHVWGRFRDLLGAVAQHPAMLFYLDNYLSTRAGFQGPGGGGRRGGLNENYARELMELHTLGVDAGYSQRDVTELARVLTGWTFVPRQGRFVFDARRHDAEPKTWLGERVPGRGQAQGEWVLDQLARHPRTAQRLAFKLAQFFVADDPPADLVQATAQAYLRSEGDLRVTVTTLLQHPAASDPAQFGGQFKTPQHWLLSMLRATGATAASIGEGPNAWQPFLQALRQLGQPLFGCITPDGYKATRAAWLDPEALARRAELAARYCQRAQLGADAASALLDTLGPALGPATRAAVVKAPAPLQAALVLGSPDFQNA